MEKQEELGVFSILVMGELETVLALDTEIKDL